MVLPRTRRDADSVASSAIVQSDARGHPLRPALREWEGVEFRETVASEVWSPRAIEVGSATSMSRAPATSPNPDLSNLDS